MMKFLEWLKNESENLFPSLEMQLAQATIEQLLALKKTEDKLNHIDNSHNRQRQNNLNPPEIQIEIERKNKAPHLKMVELINKEIARRN